MKKKKDNDNNNLPKGEEEGGKGSKILVIGQIKGRIEDREH